VGGAAALASTLPWAMQQAADIAPAAQAAAPAELADVYPLNKPENIIYTACLQCNTGCGIKAKLIDGVVAKIDGNPFSPMAFWPHLPYETSPLETGTESVRCHRKKASERLHDNPR
jgi:anaerobic selenocysteine-containing dehydrogenase